MATATRRSGSGGFLGEKRFVDGVFFMKTAALLLRFPRSWLSLVAVSSGVARNNRFTGALRVSWDGRKDGRKWDLQQFMGFQSFSVYNVALMF